MIASQMLSEASFDRHAGQYLHHKSARELQHSGAVSEPPFTRAGGSIQRERSVASD